MLLVAASTMLARSLANLQQQDLGYRVPGRVLVALKRLPSTLPIVIGAGKFMAAQLYGVSFWDPFALMVAAGSLAGCTFLAAIVPAGRAATISPMSALRTE